MRYPVPGRGKPMGLIALSRNRSSSPSMEDDDEEVERFSPRYKEYIEPSYFNNDSDDDVVDVYDPLEIDWPAMKKAQQERRSQATWKMVCGDGQVHHHRSQATQA